MAVTSIQNLDPATDTFSQWLDATNEIITQLRTHVVTAETGAYANTDGDARLNGEFVANTVSVTSELRGGMLNAIDQLSIDPADLMVTSNTVFTNTAALVTVTNETLMIGDVEAQSNVSVTGLAGSTRIEGANVDFLTAGARLSTVRIDEDGSLFIGADAGNTGVANTHIVLSTDGITALEIDQRDVRFSNNLGTLQNFYWDSTNERLGIHNAIPAAELDVTGNTHTTNLFATSDANTNTLNVRTDATIGNDVFVNANANTGTLHVRSDALIDRNLVISANTTIGLHANTGTLRVRTDATVGNNLAVANTTTSDKLVVVGLANTDLLRVRADATIDNNLTVANTFFVDKVDATSVTTDSLTIGTQASKATISYTANLARTYTVPEVTSSSFVMTEGNQTINGTKTFTSTIDGGVSGNAGSVTHDVSSTNANHYLSFVSGLTAGTKTPLIDGGLTYNPATDTLNIVNANFTGTVSLPGEITLSNTTFQNIFVNANTSIHADATALAATHIPVFTADPAANDQVLLTRTPSLLMSDLGINRTLTIDGGTYISIPSEAQNLGANRTWQINHDTTTRSNTTTSDSSSSAAGGASISFIDQVLTNSTGHVTGTITKTTTIPHATSGVFGVTKLSSNTVQTTAASGITTTSGRTYGVQFDSNDRLVVNVPWVDTKYSEISVDEIQSTASTVSRLITGRRFQDGLDSNRTIAGTWSFNNPIIGNLSGNAETVENGVYTVTDQVINGFKTFNDRTAISSASVSLPNTAEYCSVVASSNPLITSSTARSMYSAQISSGSSAITTSSSFGGISLNTIIGSSNGSIRLVNYLGDGRVSKVALVGTDTCSIEDVTGGSFSAQRWCEQNVIVGSEFSKLYGGANNLIAATYDCDMATTATYCTQSAIIGSYASNITGSQGSPRTRSSILVGSLWTETNESYALTMGYVGAGTTSTANRTIELDAKTGNIKASGTITPGATFSDFAEMFPNATGKEIGPGTIVTLDNGEVRPAESGEDIIGVVSHTAAVLAGDSPFCWSQRYLTDEWGREIFEEIEDPNDPTTTVIARKENPEWDPDQEQVKRSDRPDQWTPVGLIGQVRVRVDDTVAPGGRIAPATGGVGTSTNDYTGLRCMTIKSPFDKQRGFGIALCLVNTRV